MTDTLHLKPNTKLVGVAHHLSTIMTRAPYGALGAGNSPKPLVETANSADADTMIAFLGIMLASEAPEKTVKELGGVLPFYALHWRCGGTSMVRSPKISRGRLYGFPNGRLPGIGNLSYAHPAVLISGNGGGRWYNFFIHGSSACTETYRHILVDHAAGPLNFYHLHAQHADALSQCEIRDSANVTVYGVKGEYQTRFLIADHVASLHVYGHGGNATSIPGSAHYVFSDCRDLLMTNMSDQIDFKQQTSRQIPYHTHPVFPFTGYFPFIVIEGEREVRIPAMERPIMWRSGR